MVVDLGAAEPMWFLKWSPITFFFFFMTNRNPLVCMQTMYVILSPPCTSSNVEKLRVGISALDVGEP
jgi:hypothetical protein